MKKTLFAKPHTPFPDHPVLIELYPALALASLVGYIVWEFAAVLP